ncbi:hypothetical protein P167DRAFT_565271 [Morchella conica CCBAS932]|uniref:Uncharacterized protein n=1 Tax=Morchella conica CCBAS932 TaxID=1392247 RepID=A0A3N4KSH5_9PEZI|nr:hypothetical protein P167DRAFT_565271 [Morchella conica CCBAS932]
MSDNDLIPTLTRTSSTSRSYWRQLNQPRMDGPYPVMPAANSSQESSRSGNRSPSSARSRKSSTSKQSLSTTLPGSDLMESLDSGSLRQPQNRGPRDRSYSSRGRGFGPGRQNTFGDHAHSLNQMPSTQHPGSLIHPHSSSAYYSKAQGQRNRTRSGERADAANATYPPRHIQHSNPSPISGRYGNQSGNHRPGGGSSGPVRGGRSANLFRDPHMRNACHPYPYDENMHGYRGELDRWPDRINAPHTMRPSDNTESYHSSGSSSHYDKHSASRSRRPQSEDRTPRRPQGYRIASGTSMGDHGARYGNRGSYGRSRSSSCVKTNPAESASKQNAFSQQVGLEPRKYPSTSIFAPPRSRVSPIPSNAPSDVDSAEYEYSGESYSESEDLHEFPRAGNLTPSQESYYLPSEASMDAITAYVGVQYPYHSYAHNHVAQRAEIVRTRRSRSLDSDEERSLRASLSQIGSMEGQPPELVEQGDYGLDGEYAGNASVHGTELPRDELQAVQHPYRRYRVLDRSLGPGMGKESRFIRSPISEMPLRISHEAWPITELSVVHQDKAGEFVTAPAMSDEAENVLDWYGDKHLRSNVYRDSSQSEAPGLQDIETAYAEGGTFDMDNTSIASSLGQDSVEVFHSYLLASRKLTDFFFNYHPETLNYRPGMGLDQNDTCCEQIVGGNRSDVAEGYAKPQEHEVPVHKPPLSDQTFNTPAAPRQQRPFHHHPTERERKLPHSQNLRARSAHRRIASEGDSSPYVIGQEPKPYIQFTITPQPFKRPNGKQGYKITGVFESFEDKSPSKVPRPLVIRKVSLLPTPPPPATHYTMSEYVSYSMRSLRQRAHTPRKYCSIQSSSQDKYLSSATPEGSSSSARHRGLSGGADSYYMEYDSFVSSPTTPTPIRGRMSIAPSAPAGSSATTQYSREPAISNLSLHDTEESLSPDFAWVVARPALTTAQQELEVELRATAARKENEKEELSVAAKEKAARLTAAATKAATKAPPKHRLIDIRKSPRKRPIEEAETKKQGTSPLPKIFEATILERVAVLEKADMDDRCPIMGTYTVRGIEPNKGPTVLYSALPAEKAGYLMIPDIKEYCESSDSDQDETSPDADTSFGHYAVRNRKSYNLPFASPNASLPNRKPPGAFGEITFSPIGKRNASEGAGESHTARSPPTAPRNGCFQPPALYPEGASLNADQRARQYEYLERERIRQATYRRNPAVFGDVKAVEDQRKAVMARQKGMAQCRVCARWREPGTRCCDVKVRHE